MIFISSWRETRSSKMYNKIANMRMRDGDRNPIDSSHNFYEFRTTSIYLTQNALGENTRVLTPILYCEEILHFGGRNFLTFFNLVFF